MMSARYDPEDAPIAMVLAIPKGNVIESSLQANQERRHAILDHRAGAGHSNP